MTMTNKLTEPVIISDNINLSQSQRELLIKYHNAVIDIPSTEQLIKAFNLPITKQSISAAAKKRRVSEKA